MKLKYIGLTEVGLAEIGKKLAPNEEFEVSDDLGEKLLNDLFDKFEKVESYKSKKKKEEKEIEGGELEDGS